MFRLFFFHENNLVCYENKKLIFKGGIDYVKT